MFDKSRHKTGRIIKVGNNESAGFGDRHKIYELGSDGVRGLGTKIMPGFKVDKLPAGQVALAYANWKEDSQETLSLAQASPNDTFIIFGDNPVADAAEIGRGLVSAQADRTFTATSTVAGATGSPPRRTFSDSSAQLDFTQNLADAAFQSTSTMTAVLKIYIDTIDANAHVLMCNGTNDLINVRQDNAQMIDGGSTKINNTWTPTLGAGYHHIVWWYDGTTFRMSYVKGFGGSGANGQPTKLSDFTDVKSSIGSYTFDDANGFDVQRTIGGTGNLGVDFYYLLFSRACLIDNGA